MTNSLPDLDAAKQRWLLFGTLEASGKLYPQVPALVVSTRNDGLKQALKVSYGGTIEPGRWVLRSEALILHVLTEWAEARLYRRAEILEAIVVMLNAHEKRSTSHREYEGLHL